MRDANKKGCFSFFSFQLGCCHDALVQGTSYTHTLAESKTAMSLSSKENKSWNTAGAGEDDGGEATLGGVFGGEGVAGGVFGVPDALAGFFATVTRDGGFARFPVQRRRGGACGCNKRALMALMSHCGSWWWAAATCFSFSTTTSSLRLCCVSVT